MQTDTPYPHLESSPGPEVPSLSRPARTALRPIGTDDSIPALATASPMDPRPELRPADAPRETFEAGTAPARLSMPNSPHQGSCLPVPGLGIHEGFPSARRDLLGMPDFRHGRAVLPAPD